LIVYVETNFILELAYLRSTSDNCERLLDLAREGKISLVVPVFALLEARVAWQGVLRRRTRLHSDVRVELGELARSRPLANIGEQSQAFVTALVDTAQDDRSRLESAVTSLIAHATVLAANAETITAALVVEQRLGLLPQDALIYGAILHNLVHAAAGPKLFVTQNATDFFIPTVQDELASYGCKLLTKFDAAEAFVRSILAG
jgi:predicted nucleic acid-binding protein